MTVTTPFPFTVSDAIRRARLDAKLTPQDLAIALNVNYQTVLRWETGKKVPGGRNLARIVAVTGAAWLPEAVATLTGDSRCYPNSAGQEPFATAA